MTSKIYETKNLVILKIIFLIEDAESFVFENKEDALKVFKSHKNARLKPFKNKNEALKFAKSGQNMLNTSSLFEAVLKCKYHLIPVKKPVLSLSLMRGYYNRNKTKTMSRNFARDIGQYDEESDVGTKEYKAVTTTRSTKLKSYFLLHITFGVVIFFNNKLVARRIIQVCFRLMPAPHICFPH